MNGCKNCPAFAKCTVTYRSSACAALRYTYGLESDPEIKTNADKLRAMSDEELAEVIICPYNIDPDLCIKKTECLSCCEEWLNQPVEPTDETTEAPQDDQPLSLPPLP